MVGAGERAAVDPAQRQRRATVNTQVTQAGDSPVQPGEHDRQTEQTRCDRLSADVGAAGDRMPVVPQPGLKAKAM